MTCLNTPAGNKPREFLHYSQAILHVEEHHDHALRTVATLSRVTRMGIRCAMESAATAPLAGTKGSCGSLQLPVRCEQASSSPHRPVALTSPLLLHIQGAPEQSAQQWRLPGWSPTTSLAAAPALSKSGLMQHSCRSRHGGKASSAAARKGRRHTLIFQNSYKWSLFCCGPSWTSS